jgi:hypothetical protein
MEQMMERLPAEMRAGHEEVMAEIRTKQEKMNNSQDGFLARSGDRGLSGE